MKPSDIASRTKSGAQSLAPAFYGAYQRRYGNTGRPARAEKILTTHYKGRVLSGPFAGMRYIDSAVCSTLFPKWIGSYEEELHAVIEAVIARQPKVIVDVGCAEGYYAIGLSLRCPNSTVYAFDIDPAARQLCEEMAKLNDVSGRVDIKIECNAKTLEVLPLQNAFIVCDCEGYELELLNPAVSPQLASCDLLIELHDFVHAGLTAILRERFAQTHDITLIDTVERDPDAYACLNGLKRTDRLFALNEARPCPMQWAFMEAKKL